MSHFVNIKGMSSKKKKKKKIKLHKDVGKGVIPETGSEWIKS